MDFLDCPWIVQKKSIAETIKPNNGAALQLAPFSIQPQNNTPLIQQYINADASS